MKDAILKKAEQQLMVGGYDKLNFTTIAGELKTTRANIHYHFKNKESLAVEVTKQYSNRHRNAFQSLRLAFRGNFSGFVNAIDQAFWQDDTSAAMCNILAADPELPEPILKLIKQLYQDIEQVIADAIQDAVDRDEVRDNIDIAREAARSHVIMMGIVSAAQHLAGKELAKAQLSGLLIDWANSLK